MEHSTAAAVAVVASAILAGPAHAGDPGAGMALFRTICTLCHSNVPGQNKAGPLLFGVVGRPSRQRARVQLFRCQQELRYRLDKGVLDKYLINPQAVVPGAPKWAIPASKTTRSAPTSSPVSPR